MLFLRILVILVGLCAIGMGILLVGQGTGVVPWPLDSFMLDDRGWAIRGAVMAAVGGILIWLARRGNGASNNHL
ncbi:MAG: hypothetical protein E2586_13050 [Novosphingobium sp.]|nr:MULTISPECIES: hypothetical protein [unclassified Novosphingobium]KPH63375.1 membrane protein [Novosphingobium sp. ST904]MPS69414.1 hypothetical protein [Novosphingobium sp.]TCM40829.1 hypothetical protein EDF59_104310 [Novosphingobium sp. ST904]